MTTPRILSFFLMVLLLFSGCKNTNQNKENELAEAKETKPKNTFIATNFKLAETQYGNMLKVLENDSLLPKTTAEDGALAKESIEGWTSGFFPGSLWMLYDYSGDEKWKVAAEKWTHVLEPIQYYTGDHDIGFRMYCSYGGGLKHNGNSKEYEKILIRSARSLCERYNEKLGLIKSWNHAKSWDGVTEWHYPVIMDNMMNLELLFYAYKKTKDEKFKQVALSHADRSMKDFYRDDYSSYHVVNYDSITGKTMNKGTAQGFSDNSAWSRGQAWGLYGFTGMYRETKDPKYLKHAEQVADFLMNHKRLPEDKIPYWDYNAGMEGYEADWDYRPETNEKILRDASAAAIAAAAFYELSTHTTGLGKEKYKKFADTILNTLGSSEYLAKPGENNNFILKHSVGSIPHGAEIDKPLIYADYYFLEALLRKRSLERNGKIVFNY